MKPRHRIGMEAGVGSDMDIPFQYMTDEVKIQGTHSETEEIPLTSPYGV